MPHASRACSDHPSAERRPPSPGRVAILHDWLTGMRGGEKVLEAICELYPDAPIYTLVRVPGSVSARIERHRIKTSPVQAIPRAGRLYRHLLPLFPAAVELFDLDRYDLVISSSHCAVKSVIRAGSRHPRLLLPLADAVCLGSVSRSTSVRIRSGATRSRLLRPVMAAAGPVGRRHGRAGGPLSREFSICCGENPSIL